MNESPLTDSIFGEEDPQEADPVPYRREGEVGPRAESPLPRRHQQPPRSRKEARAAREREAEVGRKRRRRESGPAPLSRRKAGMSCLALVVVFAVLIGGGTYVLRSYLPHFGDSAPTDYAGKGTGSVQITVNRGDTGYKIGTTLQKAGVVKSAKTFAGVATHSSDFTDIKPGTYRLRHHMSSKAAILLMLDPTSLISHGITIREGLWDGEIFKKLSKATGVPVSAYKHVDPSTLGLPAAADGKLEGYLFPSTYDFDKGASAQQQLKQMVQLGNRKRASLHIPASALNHIMTVASLVQAESRLGPDGPKVARVVENRLQKGMKLQMDSTVHFVEQKRGTVTTSDKERASKSPYNTYKVKGLPPGPINNPGLAAIEAALHPADGSWLYFVTVNQKTGKTLFATTYAQQQKNEKKFQHWCQNHKGQC